VSSVLGDVVGSCVVATAIDALEPVGAEMRPEPATTTPTPIATPASAITKTVVKRPRATGALA